MPSNSALPNTSLWFYWEMCPSACEWGTSRASKLNKLNGYDIITCWVLYILVLKLVCNSIKVLSIRILIGTDISKTKEVMMSLLWGFFFIWNATSASLGQVAGTQMLLKAGWQKYIHINCIIYESLFIQCKLIE